MCDEEAYKIITCEMDDPKFVLTTLNVSSIPIFPPYSIIEKNVIVYPNKEPATIVDGIEVQIFREYANRYNIILNFTINENAWGKIYTNRTGDGVYADVIESRFNAAIGAMTFSARAVEFVEYANAEIDSRIICLVPIPRNVNKFLLVFFPFTLSLWLAIICSIITLTITLSFLTHKAQLFDENHTRLNKQNVSFIGINKFLSEVSNGCSKSLLIICYLTLLQPISKKFMIPKLSNRIFYALSFFHTLLISAAYIGGLAAILTLPQYEQPIRTRQDLIDSKMEWGTHDMAYIYPIANSNHSQINILLKTCRVYDDEKLRNLPPRTFAYIVVALSDGSYKIPDYISKQGIKALQLMDQEIFNSASHAIFRKSSPFLLKYNQLVRRLTESGIIYQIREQLCKTTPLCVMEGG
ncbi:uncharacterized protein LOC123297863 [Chrysoperla carnea]|uniref:uncharacterized protein LOC123297863 n=1 Tax=Chrysoperla carnea TaxID=189513 RepID=UPI001D08074C|nr:uncharacterized protein LOC123297863 [Chrysoperla carnea]